MNFAEPTETPALSVSLCTRDGQRFIREQLESILEQSQSVNQIVLSDDDSSDDTVSIAKSILQADATSSRSRPELVLMQNSPALGVTRNFQQSVQACSGEWIFLSDQDDLWMPDKVIRLQVAASLLPDAWLFFTNARIVDANGSSMGYTLFDALELSRGERRLIRRGRFFELLLRRNVVTGATVMLRRQLADAALPFPSAWLHDEWLAVVAASQGRLSLVEECLIEYRQHDANAIGQTKLSLRQKADRFSEPLSNRSARLHARAQQLHEFLKHAPDVPQRYRDLSAEKLRFESARLRYPSNRIARIPVILARVLVGDYRRFGTGLKDVVRNILQPA